MSEKTQTNSITIAGAGFCGTTILANQIREIQRAWAQAGEPDNFPQTKIIVTDPRADYGPGDPYEQKSLDNRALLNQAAYAMSPFPDEPDHFTNYLDNRFDYRSREDLENSFQQRPIYGEYLSSVFDEAVQIANAANFPVEVELIPAAITDAFDLGDQTWQVSANARLWDTDQLIIADGHHKNEYLTEFEGHSLYFDGHLNRDEFKTINGTNNRVLIVGSGQTMIDRLAELENYGYEGEVHSASRRGVLPWLFEPELYNPNNTFPPYQLSFFTSENTAKSTSANDLQFLWEKEIARACTTGYGPGHILGAFYKEDSIFKGFEHPDSEIWKIQLDRISAWYGNPTSPQRYELYQKAIREKQFISHQSSIKSDQIEACDDGFIVQINGNPIKFDAIFNAASCARSLKNPQGQIRSPLISNLDERGSIKWDNLHHGIILAGQQQKNGLYYAGPYSFPGKWGVETFRTSLQETALQSLNLQQRLQLTA